MSQSNHSDDLGNLINQENQLHHTLIGVGTGWSSFMANDSSSRLVMESNHITQGLIMEGAETNRLLTGIEREYAEATFKCKIPGYQEDDDLYAIAPNGVIPKYRRGLGKDAIDATYNPETVVILQDLKANKQGRMLLDVTTIKSHHCLHPTFGFKFKKTKGMGLLEPGSFIRSGTTLAKSPIVTDDGNYQPGINAMTIPMSIPQIVEDGFVVSKSFCERMATLSIGTRMVGWGKRRFPINLYGKDGDYKPFPEIGQIVRPDGLLFALREYDERLAAVDMSAEALDEPDVYFDKLVFAPPGARIIDIKIMKGDVSFSAIPPAMCQQVEKYHKAQLNFYGRILTVYREYRKKYRNDLQLSPELDRLIVEALVEEGDYKTNTVKVYRAAPIDEWTVEIKYELRVVPTVGFKISNLHGGDILPRTTVTLY